MENTRLNSTITPAMLSFALAALVLCIFWAPSIVIHFLLFFMVFLASLLLFAKYSSVPRYIIILMTIGFLVKSYYAYSLFTTTISPFPDSLRYLRNLNEVNSNILLDFKQMSSAAATSQFSYYYLMYAVKLLTGSVFAQYMANITLFFISSIFFYRVVTIEFGQKIANRTMILYLLSMTMFLFTSNILKDSWVLFWFMLSLYLYKKHQRFTIILLLSLIVLLTGRIYAGVSLFIAIYVDFLFKFPQMNKTKALFHLVIPPAILYVIVYKIGLSDSVGGFSQQYSLSSYIPQTIKGLGQLFFSPYFYGTLKSNEITTYSIIEIDSAFFTFFSFALVLFIVKLFRYRVLRAKMYLYLIPIFIHAATLGLAYDGGSIRQRICVFGSMIMLYMIGMFYKPEQQKENTPL